MKVLLGVPGTGLLCEPASQTSWLASLHHDVDRLPCNGFGPNFNACWTGALNTGMAGTYSHFAMIHTDIGAVEEEEGKRWLDRMIEDMEKVKCQFLSVPMAIKDCRGLTATGIGNPDNRWNPWRRFTTKELDTFPPIFNAAMLGYADKYLLHSGAMCLWDMRWPGWYEPDEDGCCRAVFNFTERVQLVDGIWCRSQDSEDWAYSRHLWQMGAQTYVTRRIKLNHYDGKMAYPNHGDWGTYKNGDENTASQWRDTTPGASPETARRQTARSAAPC